MKKFKSLYIRGLFVLTILGAASCSIDEYNPSGTTTDNIWSTTPEGFATSVNGAYNEIRYWYGKEDGMLMSEAGTDIWFNKGYVGQLSQYVGLSSGTNYIKSTWKSVYSGINVCNGGLDHIDDVAWPADTIPRQQAEGQLRFLRAFYYWHVVETWGNVRLTLHETTDANLTATRSSVNEFYDQIFADLEIAVRYLPVSWGSNYGRASKKAAMGMLARAYLSRAYYGNDAAYFTKARDMAKQVIDQQATLKTALKTNYADLWSSAANNRAIGKDGGEGLFVVANSTTQAYNYDANGNRLHATYQTPYNDYPGLATSIDYGLNGSSGNPVLLPTLSLLDMYDETMDSRFAGSFQLLWKANKAFTWAANSAKNNDTKDASIVGATLAVGDTAMYVTKGIIANKELRKYTTYDRTNSYNADGTFKNGTDNYVTLKKFRDYNRTSATTQPGFNDAIIMRLAEMYLIAAEAEFQLGNLQAAADYINVLRTRAAIKTPVDHTADMQITDPSIITLDFILDEYAREFAGEMRRWFDLKRTGKLADRVKALNPNIPTAIDQHFYVRPISIDEMNALTNSADFKQNPDYN